MERLTRSLGNELDIGELPRVLYAMAGDLRAPVVGAMQLTCADESERECRLAFRREIADPLLPRMRFGERAIFKLTTLGARYEQGGLAVADDHYSTEEARKKFKLMLIKNNAHVCVDSTPEGVVFGAMPRYDRESIYCGALHALLDGATLPFARELAEQFAEGGVDRLAMLRDAGQVPAAHRSLLVAVVQAELQARRILQEVVEIDPQSPTIFVLLSAVTLNRRAKDGEILCGVRRIDRTGEAIEIEEETLGDDPTRLEVEVGSGGGGVRVRRSSGSARS